MKVKLIVPLCVYICILPGKAVPEMTYTVSSGTLNPTRSRSVQLRRFVRALTAQQRYK